MKKKILNVGVIGVGNMGRHHARVYSQLTGVELIGIADVDENRGMPVAKKYGCKFYKDYRRMLTEEKLDAVSIVVPLRVHEKVALHCIGKRIPVFIEKPIAPTLDSAKRIIHKAKRRKVALGVGHIERFNPAIQSLKEFITQKKFGRIISIWIKRVGLFPSRIKDTNVIMDLAIHDIDVCNYLLNRRPKRVYAKAGKALNSKRLDYASIFLDYGPVDVSIQANWITPIKVRKLSITGTKGFAEVDYINQTLRLYEDNYHREFDSFGDFIIKFGTPEVRTIKTKIKEPLKIELQNFCDYLRGRKAMVVRGEEAFLNLAAALKAIESCKKRRARSF